MCECMVRLLLFHSIEMSLLPSGHNSFFDKELVRINCALKLL